MPNHHREKHISKLLIGFIFIIAGIFSIIYSCFEKAGVSDWYFWGIIASALICTGLYFLLSSFVHKIKSDLIEKQKNKDRNKTPDQNL